MPTHDETPRFNTEFKKLSPERQLLFRRAVAEFVADLRLGGAIRPSLRVKRVVNHRGVWEISFGPDDRASFHYVQSTSRDQHVVWRRIGRHEILGDP